ncbi:MAG: GWxTD domain-containing protein [bacterium]|nr:GWxTD domain-containing protein [bacterium]
MRHYLRLAIMLLVLTIPLNVNGYQSGYLRQSATISGRITDSGTGEPLYLANVYLSNTTKGNASNREGEYAIFNIPFGNYKLIVSYVGHKPFEKIIRIDDNKVYEFDFTLEPTIQRMSEVTVKGEYPKDWKKHYKIFKREFLGFSWNAEECEILNPLMIGFRYDKREEKLFAYADDIIEVENRALGYKLNILLKDFSYTEEECVVKFYPHFEEMTPEDENQKKKWTENKEKAYNGSLNHFIYATLSKRFHREKFELFKMRVNKKPKRIPADSLISLKGHPWEIDIRFDGNIVVLYNGESEENGYRKWVYDKQNLEIFDKAYLKGMEFQKTILKLDKDRISVHKDGYTYDASGIKRYGHMAYERIAEFLPRDYKILPRDKLKFKDKYLKTDRENQTLEENTFKNINDPTTATYLDSIYQRGMKYKNSGNYKLAANIWLHGRNEMILDGETDFRVGIALIETVTEHELTLLYEHGSRIYLESLTGENFLKHPDAFRLEVERIRPLLMAHNRKREYNKWLSLIDNNDPAIAARIRSYWIDKDPTPATEDNERLIEHWERIAYCRKNFTKNDNTVYGTDDRALIYMKYGEPDLKREGIMPGLPGSHKPRRPLAVGRTPRVTANIKKDYIFDWRPEYQIWIYDRINENPDDHLVYVFGPKNSKGPFGLRNGVEELLDDAAFREIENSTYIVPGLNLIMSYYLHLRPIDSHFGERFSMWKIAMDGLTPGKSARWRIIDQKEKHVREDRNDPRKVYAPKDKSVYEDIINPIRMITTQTRILDNSNEPAISIMSLSYPSRTAFDYDLEHTLIVRDNHYDEVDRYTHSPDTKFDNVSVFNIAHKDSSLYYTIASEAIEDFPHDSLRTYHIGKTKLEKKKPLDPDPEKLELSDIVTGIQFPDSVDKELFPFPLLPSERIVKGDPMLVYIEMYHLFLGPDEKSHYEIKYQIERKRKTGWLYRVPEYRKIGDTVARSFIYEGKGRTAKEAVSMDISGLREGEYLFTIEVKDIVSGGLKSRDGEFEIFIQKEKK